MKISVEVCGCIFKAAVMLMNAMINMTWVIYLSDIDLCAKTQCAAVLIKAHCQYNCLDFDYLEWCL